MPAIVRDIKVEGGSYEPQYWEFTNPDTGALVDLTVPGYTVVGSVVSTDSATLLTFTDADFTRTSTGRVYFSPSSDVSATWDFERGDYQFYLVHPVGQDVRFGEGRFLVSQKI